MIPPTQGDDNNDRSRLAVSVPTLNNNDNNNNGNEPYAEGLSNMQVTPVNNPHFGNAYLDLATRAGDDDDDGDDGYEIHWLELI
ncbi:hypothetical protein Ct61P_14553 [Colletotrichum tofieldiae]|nr:hypothetical protein Ct61P_14553 [Colletotrichum tofieldiae]